MFMILKDNRNATQKKFAAKTHEYVLLSSSHMLLSEDHLRFSQSFT